MPAMNSDVQFEQTFSDLSFAVLQDKAPAMIDYLVGFQVLDANEDQTRAVGVFGCQLGEEWIYIPMFFLNGELKGGMMYLKDQDLFCPMQENWVQYVLQRKPYKLGDISDITKKDLAGTGMDMLPFRASPRSFGKTAAFKPGKSASPSFMKVARGRPVSVWRKSAGIQPWAKPAQDALMNLPLPTSEDYVKSAAHTDLVEFVKQAGPKVKADLLATMRKYASFGNLVAKFYPVKKLEGIQFSKKAESPVLPDVSITKYDPKNVAALAFGFDDKEKARLMKGEIVIKDRRNDVSKVYKAEIPKELTTPTETGVYNILTPQGTLLKCFVLRSVVDVGDDKLSRPTYVRPTPPNYSQTDQSVKNDVIVVNMEGPGYKKCCGQDIFGVRGPRGNFKFAEDFADLKPLSEVKEGHAYIFVTPSGAGVEPVCILKKTKDDNDQTVLWTDYDIYADQDDFHKNNWGEEHQIILAKNGSKIVKIGGVVFVPPNARCLEVNRKTKAKNEYVPNAGMPPLGDVQHLQHYLWATGKAIPLKVMSNGTEYGLTIGESDLSVKTAGFLGMRTALDQLIFNHGVHGEKALEMLKAARDTSHTGRGVNYWISYAKGYPNFTKKAADPFMSSGAGSPAFVDYPASSDPYAGVPVVPHTEVGIPVNDLRPPMSNYDIYNPDVKRDTNIYDTINNAARTGQKEVFDTAVVGGLVKTMDVDALVDKYLGDLILGMDRVGRIYFLFLYHNDEFSERYGQNDMLEMEDSLKNTFKGVGDLVLALKQKTVEKSKSQDRSAIDVGPNE